MHELGHAWSQKAYGTRHMVLRRIVRITQILSVIVLGTQGIVVDLIKKKVYGEYPVKILTNKRPSCLI
jgi:hypothetical protein